MTHHLAGKKSETRPADTPINVCFGCGEGNDQGMHLPFERDAAAQRVRGRFRLPARYQGAPGIIHGGIIAVVFDEALGKVNRFHDVRAVTAELTVEYLRPIRVDQEIHVEAFHVERNDRNLIHEGEIRDAEGRLLARSWGRFVAIDPETYRRAAGITVPGAPPRA